jgi:hypothetical protein
MRLRTVVLATAALISIVLVSTAGAGRPAFNPVCLGTKIEGGDSGVFAMTYGDQVGTITIAVEDSPLGPVFSFDTGNPQHVVGQVDVKGGTALNTYVFDGDGVTAASGLHAAVNPTSGFYYGISYICFHTAAAVGEGGGEE